MAKYIKLSSGQLMPTLCLGTYMPEDGQAKKEEIYAISKKAIEMGYPGIDTAFFYLCEEGIGDALHEIIKSGQKKREDIFITTKIWKTYMRPDRVRLCALKSLERLQLDYVDLLLIHWPMAYQQQDEKIFPFDDKGSLLLDNTIDYLDSYKALENLLDEGLAKAIGVSNFNIKQLERILKNCRHRPSVLQVEIHPRWPNTKLVNFCHENGIVVTAYSPLGKGIAFSRKPGELVPLVQDPVITRIAEKHHKTPAQILLAWGLAQNITLAVKSYNEQRMKENLGAFDVVLDKDDLNAIGSIKEREKLVALPWLKNTAVHYPFNEE